MAQRRMFNKAVTNNDNFLEMPASSQNLYFHLSMNADDDGFIDNWKSIIRMIGAKEDDLKILITKQFILPFESGVIVIRHWRLNNYLQKDRLNPTIYQEELSKLSIEKDNVYEMYTTCIHSIDKNSIDKNSIDKNSIDKYIGNSNESPKTKSKKFTKPTLEEINNFILENNLKVNGEHFYDYYESNGWKVGKNSMKDWKATLRNWNRNNFNEKTKSFTKTKNEEQWEFLHELYEKENSENEYKGNINIDSEF